MISRPVDNEEQRNLIGIWEKEAKIVALATFELTFAEIHICLDPDYRYLFPEIIAYAEEHLSAEGLLHILLPDNDRELQKIAARQGFTPTGEKEPVSVLDIPKYLTITLPEGFGIVSMADNWDFYQYNRVMWRGFGHEGEPAQEKEDIEWRETMLSSPHLLPELVLAVVSPQNTYASHCGLWYIPGSDYAYLEPLVTDPAYRQLGLGKAVLLEAARRAAELGAKEVYVCSEQQFYYNLGFYPLPSETWWKKSSSA
jgi:GNAT superfamily N-acetyltransferase